MTEERPAYWERLEKHTDWDEIWMNHPLVRARINKRVTGTEGQWPLLWFKERMGKRIPFESVLSIGCGVGNLERSLIEHGIALAATGVDTSTTAIGEARTRAEQAGMAGRIEYVVADSRRYLAGLGRAPAVFFHESLHHFDRLDELLTLVREALIPAGILYLDEYVGPARTEWSISRMAFLNAVYRLLPSQVRRVGVIRRPINREDPTEAVASSGIHSAVGKHFRVLERRDYGGNLLAVLYPALRRPTGPADPLGKVFDATVERLLNMEERILRQSGVFSDRSFQSVVVAAAPG